MTSKPDRKLTILKRRGAGETSKKACESSSKTAAISQGPRLLTEFLQESETQRVRFSLFRPNAQRVCVAGTFNDWHVDATPMSRNPDGTWSLEILLNPGTYEYRFVVDDEWTDDPLSLRYVRNPYGSLNSVLEVKASGSIPSG